MYGRWGCGGGGRPNSGCGAGGVAVAQEASRGGGVRVLLLKGSLGVLGVGCAVVQVWAGADRSRNLSGQHQAGLHICLRVDVRLGQPAHRHKGGGALDQRTKTTTTREIQHLAPLFTLRPEGEHVRNIHSSVQNFENSHRNPLLLRIITQKR